MAKVIAWPCACAYKPDVNFATLVGLVALAGSTGLAPASLEALRAIDLRLATIGHRLAVANVALCRDRAPATGMVLHALTQYDAATAPAAKQVFRFATPIAVEAVVPGSAADRAGVRANDGVASIQGTPLTTAETAPSSADRDAVLARLDGVSGTVRLGIAGRGDVMVAAPPGCRASYEVLLGPEMTAQSDGRVVQIGVRFFERYRDEETAVIVAHELAHVILRHRARLEAAGVKGGLLGELGRNATLGQRAETEADVLGVALLYNAGYDPASAARFWREHGGDIDGGLFRSRTHPATNLRVKAIEAAAAAIPRGAARPYTPPVLAERDRAIK